MTERIWPALWLPPVRPQCCDHARYISHTWDGLELCTCSTCGHRWTVVHVLKPRTPFDDLVDACRR